MATAETPTSANLATPPDRLRIYLSKDGLKIIILIGGGGAKNWQQQDIDQAVALWEDFKRRRTLMKKGK